jgi:hypothetical protein
MSHFSMKNSENINQPSHSVFLRSKRVLLISTSPCASHLLASTSCMTFTYCLKSMNNDETVSNNHGKELLILLALNEM